MSTNNCKSFFEEMQDSFKIESMRYNPIYNCESGLYMELKFLRTEQICPHCKSDKTIVHDYTQKTIKEGTLNGVPVLLNLKHCRYICQECQSTFMQKFCTLPEHKRQSVESENYILSMLGSLSFSEIANQVGVCVQTIANRANDFAKREKELSLKCKYKYLSMDEVFVSRNSEGDAQYYWLLNDISKHWKSNNIRIDKGRNKEDVITRLKELKYFDSVEAVSIDMWRPYKEAICEALPKAAIVVDPFHLIKIAESAMDSVRKRTVCSDEVKSTFKKDAKLFLSSFFKLTDDELIRLDSYLKMDTNLEKIYFAVQELLGFYWLRDYEHALNYIANWERQVIASGIKEFESVLNTIQNWLPYIMNYFICRITNGKTEGKNHLLRAIDKIGFHYGVTSLQACIYAHDRKQEFKKWKTHQKKKESLSAST